MSCSKSEVFSTLVDSLAVIGAFSLIAFAVCLVLFIFTYYAIEKKDWQL